MSDGGFESPGSSGVGRRSTTSVGSHQRASSLGKPPTHSANSSRQSASRSGHAATLSQQDLGTATSATVEERMMNLRMNELLHRDTSSTTASIAPVGCHFDPSKPFQTQLRDLSPRVTLKSKDEIWREHVENRRRVLEQKKESQRQRMVRERHFHRAARQQEVASRKSTVDRLKMLANPNSDNVNHISSTGVARDNVSAIAQSSPGPSAQNSVVLQSRRGAVIVCGNPSASQRFASVASAGKAEVDEVHAAHLLRAADVEAYFAVPAFLKPLIAERRGISSRGTELNGSLGRAPPKMLPSEQPSRSGSVEAARMRAWDRASDLEFRRAQEKVAAIRR